MKLSFLLGFATTSTYLGLSVALPMSALALSPRHLPNFTNTGQYGDSELHTTFARKDKFAKAPVSIRDAITIAEKQSPGIRVVDIRIDDRAESLAYNLIGYRGDETWRSVIDASTGRFVGNATVTHGDNGDAEKQLTDFEATGIFLSDAVEIAEKVTAGKAVGAGLEDKDGRLSMLVDVVEDGALKEVAIAADKEKSPKKKR